MLLAACSAASDEDSSALTLEKEEPVSFTTDFSYGSTRATTGLINNIAALQEVGEGFGVFAYQTENQTFATKFPNDASYSSYANFFMQNQQVTYGVQWVDDKGDADPSNDESHYDWVYSPLKYWPNYTNNDNSTPDGNDTPAPRYISFFAYAPYAETTDGETGVINYTRSADRTPHVIYKIGAFDQQVDLLWAKTENVSRNDKGLVSVDESAPEGEELTFQKVPLYFGHALSTIDIYAQRVYDEPAYTGKIPVEVLYPTLFISKLKLASTTVADDGKNGLQLTGRLDLRDGSWSDYDNTWTGTTPNAWVGGSEVSLTYSDRMLNDTIRGTLSTDETFIRDIELDKWKWIHDTKDTDDPSDDEWVDATSISEDDLVAHPNRWKSAYGVSEEERLIIRDGYTQVLIPRRVTLVPTLTYSMVVRDDDLLLNYYTDSEGHRYNRIVNEVVGNTLTLDLVAGKRYSLLMRIGVEHVTFELLSVVDWDFPMRFDPSVVTGFEEEAVGKIVNE